MYESTMEILQMHFFPIEILLLKIPELFKFFSNLIVKSIDGFHSITGEEWQYIWKYTEAQKWISSSCIII